MNFNISKMVYSGDLAQYIMNWSVMISALMELIDL